MWIRVEAVGVGQVMINLDHVLMVTPATEGGKQVIGVSAIHFMGRAAVPVKASVVALSDAMGEDMRRV